MLNNAGKFRDRNPDTVPAAGKLFAQGGTAKDCLKTPQKPRTPEQVHKFRCTTQSAPAKTRIFYGRYSDPDIASLLTHGINTRPSFVAGQLINPRPKSYFEYRLNQKREESVYASQKRAPLGRSHDQRAGLPAIAVTKDITYGIPSMKDWAASELINPKKTWQQVREENQKGLELYKKSHSAYVVGESYNRNYDWSRIPATSSFGIETPHDNRGFNTKKTLKWMHETLSKKAAPITSKRVDRFRERNIPQVGIVHDPIKETMNVAPDHTFGIVVKADECGAGDLIHMRTHSNFSKRRPKAQGVLSAIWDHLKKANYHNFDDLKASFAFYDKDQSGKIDINELRDVCLQLHLPLKEELLEMVIDSCDIDKDKQIDYVEFANFLNWKDRFSSGLDKDKLKSSLKNTGDATNQQQNGQQIKERSDDDYPTSSLVINGDVNNNPTKNLQPHGIPTIRCDLPAPRIRRIGDNTNYGDESDAYGLINPSIYSNYGVYEEDFFKARDQPDLRRIFDSIGVEMTNDVFQQMWEKAGESSPDGQVSVETFRNVLDYQIAEEYEKVNNQECEANDILNAIRKKPALYEKFHPERTVQHKEVLAS